jgi:catechol 2,3-dioxygenase-like lactoylglutathione lyase family enzyme
MTYVIGHLLLPRYASWSGDSSDAGSRLLGMTMTVEKISAVTFRVLNMKASVRFYINVLGMEIIYGGEDGSFSSLRAKDANTLILNLEQGRSVPGWGRMIFYVADVDAFLEYLRGKGFNPESPRDASWGERYFHMSDPDGHELSFALPI